MGNRRFAQVSTSDEEDDEPLPATRISSRSQENQRRRKKIKLPEYDDDEFENDLRGAKKGKTKKGRAVESDEEEEEEEEEDAPVEDAKPVGEAVRVSGKGRGRRSHFESFEYDGNVYELEDPVLLVPEDEKQKPYVAIIKDIAQTNKGVLMVTGQWFYRPEEAERKGGGSWQSRDTRELFYSFHRDEVPAESVMHKCVVHFVPIHKQLPNRKQYPGFIVQKVYDTVERKLWKLTDKDYEDIKQHEIDLLVQKTLSRLGDLPDIEVEENPAEPEDPSKFKRIFRKKNITPLDVSREEDATGRPDSLKAETPGSCTGNSEYFEILVKFDAPTGDTHRDKWLERLLHCIRYMCSSSDDDKVKAGSDHADHEKEAKDSANGAQQKNHKSSKPFCWPNAVVPAVSALEKASHETLSSDFQKYNQKMRQLLFNLKNSPVLARRLLNGELEPSKILNMSPNELKEGLTAEETLTNEPDESSRMQMTDASCSRCNESKVGVRDIIQAGHADRYQLECIACGHSWYASRDEASMLTIDGPNSAKSVGTAPWATKKFEEVEKKLLSPREPEKTLEVAKKASEPLEAAKKLLSPREPEKALEVAKKASEPLEAAKKLLSPREPEKTLEVAKKASEPLEAAKKLLSPREPEKTSEIAKKAIEPSIPAVDSQKPFVKPKIEQNSDTLKPFVKPKIEENSDNPKPYVKPKSEENSDFRRPVIKPKIEVDSDSQRPPGLKPKIEQNSEPYRQFLKPKSEENPERAKRAE
ncbi:hypothetical protein M5689_008105 [Euphorbia peplus]|nr:hypothetical protein M5689_008105 [Euphorbia peplus]